MARDLKNVSFTFWLSSPRSNKTSAPPTAAELNTPHR